MELSQRETLTRVASGNFQDEVKAMRARLKKTRGGPFRKWAIRLVQPGKLSRRWDVLVFATLIFTAIVTPMEIAFMGRGLRSKSITSQKNDSAGDKLLFALNRIVDIVFLVELLKHIALATLPETPGDPKPERSSFSTFFCSSRSCSFGGEEEDDDDGFRRPRRQWGSARRDRMLEAKKEAKTMIPIDIIAAIPYDIIALAANDRNVGRFRFLRMLRLLRLLKLGNVGEIIRHILARHALSYATLAICKYIAIIILAAHWMTCIWVLTANLQSNDVYTWVDALADTKNNIDTELGRRKSRILFHRHSVSHRYTRGLYFTVYVLTGLGLGDVVPSTNTETAVAICLIAWGGIMWAFIIGNFCSSLTTIDVHDMAFRQRMDELNYMMEEKKFPPDLRERCRTYFQQSKYQQRISAFGQLEKLMSAGLRAEVAAAAHGPWLQEVWYLKDASRAFVAEISVLLNVFTFAPTEHVDVGPPTLFILRSGLCAKQGRILGTGSVWGADFVVADYLPEKPVVAVALTYVDAITLSRDDLEFVLMDFPTEASRIHGAMLWYLARAHLRVQGREIIKARHGGTPTPKKRPNVISRFASRPLYRERSKLTAYPTQNSRYRRRRATSPSTLQLHHPPAHSSSRPPTPPPPPEDDRDASLSPPHPTIGPRGVVRTSTMEF